MQQFSLVYNNMFVFLEPVDEPQPTYDCGQLMQGSSTVQMFVGYPDRAPVTLDVVTAAIDPNIDR